MADHAAVPIVGGLDLTRRAEAGATVVVCEGEIEMSTTALLTAELDAIAGTTGHVVLDLAGVTFLDSCGIGSILAGQRSLQTDFCRLTLADPTPAIRRVLELAGVTSVVPVTSRQPVDDRSRGNVVGRAPT